MGKNSDSIKDQFSMGLLDRIDPHLLRGKLKSNASRELIQSSLGNIVGQHAGKLQ